MNELAPNGSARLGRKIVRNEAARAELIDAGLLREMPDVNPELRHFRNVAKCPVFRTDEIGRAEAARQIAKSNSRFAAMEVWR